MRNNAYENAVRYRGGNVAVSASAGCGKTTTMIKRITDIITTEKIGAEQLLVVTFTRAAAAEMKEKLKNSLIQYPEDSFEYNQALNLELCDISTIHSFCNKVCLEFFNIAGISPDFTIIEENDSAVYKNTIIRNTLEEYYRKGDELVNKLSRIFTYDRTDKGLLEVIERLYDMIINLPQPEKYLSDIALRCCERDADINPAAKFLCEDAADAAQDYIRRISCQQDLCVQNALSYNDGFFEDVIMSLANIDKNKDVQYNINAVNSVLGVLECKISTQRNLEKNSMRYYAHERTKNLKKDIKTRFSAILANLLSAADKDTAVKLDGVKACISKICEITLKAYDDFRTFKRENSYMDFNDLEYYTLKVLYDKNSRNVLQSRYKYIFVDEFQDTNRIQDEIITLLENGGNLFIVGDFKQSIYRFRGAENEIFKEKTIQNNFKEIILDTNFRSDKRILDFVNAVFSPVMRESFSLINYSQSGMLNGGYVCSMSDNRSPVIITSLIPPENNDKEFKGVYSVEKHAKEGDYEELKRAAAEGAYIAEEIIKLIQGKTKLLLDPQEKEKRYACGKNDFICYDDITVLVRAKKTFTKELYFQLLNAGIPVSAEFSYALSDYAEITEIINYLKLIDNFKQDIYLLASLKGAFGGFTEEETAQIRIKYREGYFYEAVMQYSDNEKGCLAEKLHKFVIKTKGYNRLSKALPCPRLIMKIIKDNNYEGYLESIDNSGDCIARVNNFISIIYQKPYAKNITEFLDYIENAADDIKLSGKVSGQLNRVHLCTIHTSKGLEYPVVFVAGCGEKFSFLDSKKKLVLHSRLGLAMDYYHSESRIKHPLYIKNALSKKINYEQVKEEINTLYVALTRAKYRLYICGTADTKKQTPLFNIYSIKNACCYFDFILNIILTDGKNAQKLSNYLYCNENYNLQYEFNIRNADGFICKGEKHGIKKSNIILPLTDYKYLLSTLQPLKNSVTGITSQENEDTAISGTYNLFTDNAALTGTTYHKILSLIDFNIPSDKINEYVQSLAASGVIDSKAAEDIDCGKIAAVLNMPQIKNAYGDIYREIPFIVQIKANEGGGVTDDDILLQGVIDILIVNGDKCCIIDYKYSSGGSEYLSQKYSSQLKLYALAVQKVLGYAVEKKTIINIKTLNAVTID